jgi:hypothetical protein
LAYNRDKIAKRDEKERKRVKMGEKGKIREKKGK